MSHPLFLAIFMSLILQSFNHITSFWVFPFSFYLCQILLVFFWYALPFIHCPHFPCPDILCATLPLCLHCSRKSALPLHWHCIVLAGQTVTWDVKISAQGQAAHAAGSREPLSSLSPPSLGQELLGSFNCPGCWKPPPGLMVFCTHPPLRDSASGVNGKGTQVSLKANPKFPV